MKMKRLVRLLLSILTGILLSFAWLGFPGWTLLFAFFPLLYLDHFFVSRKTEFKPVSFWGHAFVACLVWNGITTWWIAYATVVGALLAILANTFLMSWVWWLGHIARRRFNASLGYAALIVFWISFEYFHYHWDIEWPWLNLGNGFANNVKIIQWYEYTGTLGGSVWILVVNVVLFRLWTGFKNNIPLKALMVRIAGLFFLIIGPVVVSFIIYNSYREDENSFSIVIVQPNIDPYNERYDFKAEEEKLENFIDLAEQRITSQTDLVIGPETLFERWPDWNVDRLEFNMLYRQLSGWISNSSNAELIFGVSAHSIYPDAESASSTARFSNETYFDVYNSALFIGQTGEGQFYHKSILVPGVEKMPFKRFLWLLNDVVFDLGGTTGSLGRMMEPVNFELKDGIKAAPVICYESVFGEYLAQFVRNGAEFIVVITNDGWWRNTYGYKQHFSFSRLRAIETRRSVARSANTGISGFINQRGDVFQPTGWWIDTSISGEINLNDKITFYVKYGDYLARITMFAGALLLLFLLVKSLTRK